MAAASRDAAWWRALLRAGGDPGALSQRPAGWGLALVRWTCAVVFILFGAGKFLNHASEAASFELYGLPAPDLFSYAVGLLELLGGLLLAAGLASRLAAVLLAGDMVAAIVLSGLLHGERVSLTLAPAMLICTAGLSALGPGRASLDARRATARRAACAACLRVKGAGGG